MGDEKTIAKTDWEKINWGSKPERESLWGKKGIQMGRDGRTSIQDHYKFRRARRGNRQDRNGNTPGTAPAQKIKNETAIRGASGKNRRQLRKAG